MSRSASISKLELLQEESLLIRDTICQIEARSGSVEHLGEDELLALLAKVRSEILEIGLRRTKLTSELPLEEIDAIGWCAKELTDAATVVRLDECELSLWGSRISASRHDIALMKEQATAELQVLEREAQQSDQFNSVSLLHPELPSLPGQGSSTGLSLKQCQAQLERELSSFLNERDNNVDVAEKELTLFEVEPSDVRALRTLDAQIQMQMDCRVLEGRTFENEPPETVDETTSLLIIPKHSNSNSIMAQKVHTILFARAKVLKPLKLTSHPRKYIESEGLRSILTREIGSRNAQEHFSGYVKDTISRVAQLELLAGLQFEVVPGVEYRLGNADPLQRFSVHPVAGSVDHEARLDRRTMFWLMSPASEKKGGIEYVDGPLHYIYSGKSRSIKPHAYYVQKQPLTIRQLNALWSDRRYGDQFEKIIPPQYRNPKWRQRFLPTFLNGKIDGFRVDEVKRRDDIDDETAADDALEVPYFVAEKICEVLGGVVCPFDIWEAGGRGVESDERQGFLFTELEANRLLKVTRKGWAVQVDVKEERAVPRMVYGESVRLAKSSVQCLESIKSPFRLEKYGRCGCEWNSVLDVSQSSSDKDKEAALHERLKAFPTTPTGLSILQPPQDEEMMPDGSEFGVTNASICFSRTSGAAPSTVWAPTSCDFIPTTHVMRSTSDYGSQWIYSGTTSSEMCDGTSFQEDITFDPANERAFIGTALYTFGLPQRGLSGPIAAFRVAIPAFTDGFEALKASTQEQVRVCGANITFIELLDGLGKQLKHCRCLRDVVLADTYVDPLFNTKTYLFPGAGFDMTFAAELPNPLSSVALFGSHLLQRPQVVERRTYAFPVGTDHVTAVLLPVDELLFEQLKRQVRGLAESKDGDGAVEVITDNDMEFAYTDTMTMPMPPGRHVMMGPLVLHLVISWQLSTLLGPQLEKIQAATKCTICLRSH